MLQQAIISTMVGKPKVSITCKISVDTTLMLAYCDTITDGGGWTVVQRRKDGTVNFDRLWWEYETGFEKLIGKFWFGLKALHCLTNQGNWEMKLEFTFTNKTKSYLHYLVFKVGPAIKGYPLTIGGYTGIQGTDPFSTLSLNGMKFTTKDRDNDKWHRGNCAPEFGTSKPLNNGWWFEGCSHIDPNADYNNKEVIYLNNI